MLLIIFVKFVELNKSSEAVSGLEPLSMNGFALKNGKMVNGCTLPMASENSHGHSHAPNGYVIHPINITSNPLAADAKVYIYIYLNMFKLLN